MTHNNEYKTNNLGWFAKLRLSYIYCRETIMHYVDLCCEYIIITMLTKTRITKNTLSLLSLCVSKNINVNDDNIYLIKISLNVLNVDKVEYSKIKYDEHTLEDDIDNKFPGQFVDITKEIKMLKIVWEFNTLNIKSFVDDLYNKLHGGIIKIEYIKNDDENKHIKYIDIDNHKILYNNGVLVNEDILFNMIDF